MNTRQEIRTASAYLVIQGVGALAWWVMLAVAPSTRAWFHHPEWPPGTLMSLWLGDLVGFVGGSLVAAALLTRNLVYARAAVWFVVGVAWFATAQCVVVTAWSGGGAWLATGLMAPATAVTTWIGIRSMRWSETTPPGT